jgi:transposase
MRAEELRPGADDIIVGIDLAAREHQAVIVDADGRRLTRFRVAHSRDGITELRRRSRPKSWQATGRVFAFEATGHVWEALAARLEKAGERYVIVNPLAVFRLREARRMDRTKTDLTDAEQIADLARTGMVTSTRPLHGSYLALRRAWGEYTRVRFEAARLKSLLRQQLFGLFPELLEVWSRVDRPGLLAVLRCGLTPAEIAALPLSEFLTRVCAERGGRRLWRAKVRSVHEKAQRSVVCDEHLEAAASEVRRIVARYDLLASQLAEVQAEVEALLGQIEEARWLATIPGLGFASVAGIIAHVGPIARYRHGRQLVKLAGTNPSRSETGGRSGGYQAMSHRGRAGLRQVVYMATVSCLAHNVRLRAHYDRLISRPERPLAKMTALGACMNKLLLWAFAVMKQRRAFELDHEWKECAA